VSSHLISTQEGLILLDTGREKMVPMIRKSIEKLGYRMQDVKIILLSHAHEDHVGGLAAMKELTGAKVMALGDDAVTIGEGIDKSPAHTPNWKPVKVDRVLKDRDTVTLGGVTMQAYWTPGHTKGCTTWVMTVMDNGKPLQVAFLGGISLHPGI